MRSSNLPTSGFLAMPFIMLPNKRFKWTNTGHNGISITLTGNTGKQRLSKYTKYSRSEKQKFYEKKVKSLLCPNIYRQQKYPVKNVFGNIGYTK